MTLNCIKLECAVTFKEYLEISKALIWNKTTFPAPNSLIFAELVENKLMKGISKNIYQYCFFYSIIGAYFK